MQANGCDPLDQAGSGGSDEKWWIPNTVVFVSFNGLNALAGWMWDLEQDQSEKTLSMVLLLTEGAKGTRLGSVLDMVV